MSERPDLLGVMLRALVGDRLGRTVDAAAVVRLDAGAAAVAGDEAWVLLDSGRPGSLPRLGTALAWWLRSGVPSLNVLSASGAGVLARQAAGLSAPVRVLAVQGRELHTAAADPLAAAVPVPEAHQQLRADIERGGAEPVEEHGVLAGEVRGLEVCRVVDDGSGPRLAVGIGAHDREMFQMLHGERSPVDALREVVAAVTPHRLPGAPVHPLSQLAASRGLRARLRDEPWLIGASEVVPAQPPVARANLKDQAPAVALATIAGRQVAVVCTTGIDVDVVPYAVDATGFLGATECVIAAPARDVIELQRRMAALARVPTELVAVEPVAGGR